METLNLQPSDIKGNGAPGLNSKTLKQRENMRKCEGRVKGTSNMCIGKDLENCSCCSRKKPIVACEVFLFAVHIGQSFPLA